MERGEMRMDRSLPEALRLKVLVPGHSKVPSPYCRTDARTEVFVRRRAFASRVCQSL
jgi:hypothetical protein